MTYEATRREFDDLRRQHLAALGLDSPPDPSPPPTDDLPTPPSIDEFPTPPTSTDDERSLHDSDVPPSNDPTPSYQQEIDELRLAVEELKNERTTLTNTITAERQENDRLTSTNQCLQVRIDQLLQEVRTVSDERDNLTESFNRTTLAYNNIVRRLNAISETNDAYRQSVREMSTRQTEFFDALEACYDIAMAHGNDPRTQNPLGGPP